MREAGRRSMRTRRDPGRSALGGAAPSRVNHPIRVAEPAFLASERSGFITGQTLHVNGGRMMR